MIRNEDGFAPAIAELLRHPERLARMRAACRESAVGSTWDAVFDRVYEVYDRGQESAAAGAQV